MKIFFRKKDILTKLFGKELPYNASELHATTKALLTEALIAEATSKNWIIA